MARAVYVVLILFCLVGGPLLAQDNPATLPANSADTATNFVVPNASQPASNFPAGTTTGNTGGLDPDTLNNLLPFVNLQVRDPQSGQEVAFSLQLLLLLTVLSLAPSIIILITSFLRIAIVLDFIKRALSLQQVPPNQVLMGIAFFLTLFIMWPTFTEVYEKALQPMAAGQLTVSEAYTEAEKPFRLFMYSQMRNNPDNIRLFMSMSGLERPQTLADVPTWVLIPAFILNELTIAFKIGILLYIPFIIIDMVVASVLMSMGMIMLPPVMISTPFKLILFVLVDGWTLMSRQLVESFLRNMT
ncbi:MAG: flagellar type III secretion system pore protein FliP [Spirochaetes bacterium]|nr:flagellar type III secretion system pore protein FliP [Spirochaetota bacterium]MBU0955343.1 flagellar type III secretion system pore protein FliP [Spirochaetota bacterium]